MHYFIWSPPVPFSGKRMSDWPLKWLVFWKSFATSFFTIAWQIVFRFSGRLDCLGSLRVESSIDCMVFVVVFSLSKYKSFCFFLLIYERGPNLHRFSNNSWKLKSICSSFQHNWTYIILRDQHLFFESEYLLYKINRYLKYLKTF